MWARSRELAAVTRSVRSSRIQVEVSGDGTDPWYGGHDSHDAFDVERDVFRYAATSLLV